VDGFACAIPLCRRVVSRGCHVARCMTSQDTYLIYVSVAVCPLATTLCVCRASSVLFSLCGCLETVDPSLSVFCVYVDERSVCLDLYASGVFATKCASWSFHVSLSPSFENLKVGMSLA
jgi:hypothetical protein